MFTNKVEAQALGMDGHGNGGPAGQEPGNRGRTCNPGNQDRLQKPLPELETPRQKAGPGEAAAAPGILCIYYPNCLAKEQQDEQEQQQQERREQREHRLVIEPDDMLTMMENNNTRPGLGVFGAP
ncbi:GD13224 [Drosophila simulans]|uniref:GD13224 n=1 Tax=Drosophila simulans TaxID=7240 RepID=B4QR34_DROSI|nr:GD13224 [Drosophila simulans]